MSRKNHSTAFVAAALLALLAAPIAPACAQSATAPAAVADTANETRVATTMSTTDRMLAPVTIQGAGPYPFIVDTAAERSVISRELARELGLPPAGRSRLLSLTRSTNATLVTVPALSFAPGQTLTLQAFAIEAQNLSASGVLGIDALRGQRVVLDFEAGEMRVGPAPRRYQPIGPDEIVVRGRTRYGQLVLVDSSAAGAPIDVVLDSGLQVSLGNEALRRLLTNRQSVFEPIELFSITGETVSADYTRVDNLRLGGVTITQTPVAFANAYFFQRLRLTRRPALLLGMDALQLFRRVAVDFPNRRAQFVLPENTPSARN